MSKIKRHNSDYSSGIPLAVGDRYYGQDLGRDFNSMLDFLSTAMIGMVGQTPLLLRGGICSQGTGFDDMNITPAFGIVGHAVDTPDDFSSLPPTVQSENILALIVESIQQTNLDLTTGTLNGVATNYVKLRYLEIDGSTRNRAKKSGSYVYEKEPSFEIVVDTVSPTIYDIQLCSFIGDGSTFLTITQEIAFFDKTDLAIGTTYIQFPGDDDPATLNYIGTWSNVSSELAGDFIRFEGGDASAFEAGQQSDALQKITGILSVARLSSGGDIAGGVSGVFTTGGLAGSRGTANTSGSLSYRQIEFDNADSVSPNTAKTDDVETRAVNRTVRKWRRVS